jgi:uncharacterized protein
VSISRREFLETTAVGAVVAGSLAGAEPEMPTRTLGKTGVKVSILVFGGGSRFTGGYRKEDKAVAILKRAFELGINYIDTGDDYGVSEQRCGLALKDHGRRGIFVATKITSRDGSAFARTLERSLKRLRIDQLDLLHIHDLTNDADLARIEAPGGVLEQLQKAKEQKLTRFIGISCHAAPLTLQTALERHDFDCAQMALNAAQAALGAPPTMTAAFENTALPVAVRKNMGIIAMKIWLQDFLPDVPERTARNLMYYTLSLPVAAAVIGSPKPEHLEENVKLAKAFKPLPRKEMLQLATALSKHKLAMDNIFRHHIDA